MKAALATSCLVFVGCTFQRGSDWVRELPPDPYEAKAPAKSDWVAPETRRLGSSEDGSPSAEFGDGAVEDNDDGSPRPLIRAEGGSSRARGAPSSGKPAVTRGLFRNTYYDFPREEDGAKDTKLFDAACAPIAIVPKEFHDQVCVQGSGRLASGTTVSFAARDCACASVCPRTGERICFERLDPRRFPNGRGATGRPITPLRTIAVDSEVIPLGTAVFIAEYAGLRRPDGSRHDGCFVAEDRGIKVLGEQVDIFTGDPAVTAKWNALVPSNQGVHVLVGDPRCKALSSAR